MYITITDTNPDDGFDDCLNICCVEFEISYNKCPLTEFTTVDLYINLLNEDLFIIYDVLLTELN